MSFLLLGGGYTRRLGNREGTPTILFCIMNVFSSYFHAEIKDKDKAKETSQTFPETLINKQEGAEFVFFVVSLWSFVTLSRIP